MKIIDERRFNFIPQKKWKELNSRERKTLGSYKSYYGHLSRTEQKIKELEDEVKILKNKKKDYVKRMIELNKWIDYLRNDFNYSFSISQQKSKNYYTFTISRSGHPTKTGGLGTPKMIDEHLRKYYKRRKGRLEELDRVGWKRFILNRVLDFNGRIRTMIFDMVSQDPSLKRFSGLNRHTFFPLK